MDKKRQRKIAELSILYAIPIITGAKDHSRLTGLQKRTQKLALKELSKLPSLNQKDVKFIDTQIETWLKDTGWWDNPTKVGTLISFCMDIIEESPEEYSPEIIKTLENIGVHLEEGHNFTHPSMTERDLLLDLWQRVYE